MKIFNQKDYDYVGQVGSLYLFNKKVRKQDPELVLVPRARYVLLDGTSRFFDLNFNETLDERNMHRLLTYARKMKATISVDTPN